MTDKERAKLSMYESLISFLSENREITITLRGFSQTAVKLRRMVDEIKVKEKVLSSDILEKTIVTSHAKDDLIFSLVPVSSALFSLARNTGNLALKEKTRYGQSFYYRILDKELIDKATVICIIAQNNLPKLKKFGITHAVLNDLGNKLQNYRLSLDNKISSLISSDVVMTMNNLFNEADNICTTMDSYVELLDDSQVEFYDDYMLVRTLENYDQKNELIDDEEEVEEFEA